MGFEPEERRRFCVDDAARPAHDRVAVGFDPREIANRPALPVPKRLIYPADMRVAMDDDDLSSELRRFLA